MSQDKPDLGEQAIDKVVEMGIASQLDEVKEINVDVRTDPGKLVQGKVDSVAVAGEGMVMKRDLRMESMKIETDNVSVNPMSVVFGKVELTRPTNADTRIVLSEADLNRALSSDYLHSKMQDLQVQKQGKSITIDVQKAEINLSEDDKLALSANIFLHDEGETKHFSAVAKPSVQDNGQRIALEILSAEGEGLSLEFITMLFEKIMELLDLRNFDIDGLTIQLKHLDIQQGKLLIRAATVVEQIPSP